MQDTINSGGSSQRIQTLNTINVSKSTQGMVYLRTFLINWYNHFFRFLRLCYPETRKRKTSRHRVVLCGGRHLSDTGLFFFGLFSRTVGGVLGLVSYCPPLSVPGSSPLCLSSGLPTDPPSHRSQDRLAVRVVDFSVSEPTDQTSVSCL